MQCGSVRAWLSSDQHVLNLQALSAACTSCPTGCRPPRLPCRLEGAAGASGLGVFPLIDEACRLPRATYQVRRQCCPVSPGDWEVWHSSCTRCTCLLIQTAHLLGLWTVGYPPVWVYMIPCPAGPGPHAAQPAGGAAALWCAQARAACVCGGPLRRRRVLLD